MALKFCPKYKCPKFLVFNVVSAILRELTHRTASCGAPNHDIGRRRLCGRLGQHSYPFYNDIPMWMDHLLTHGLTLSKSGCIDWIFRADKQRDGDVAFGNIAISLWKIISLNESRRRNWTFIITLFGFWLLGPTMEILKSHIMPIFNWIKTILYFGLTCWKVKNIFRNWLQTKEGGLLEGKLIFYWHQLIKVED